LFKSNVEEDNKAPYHKEPNENIPFPPEFEKPGVLHDDVENEISISFTHILREASHHELKQCDTPDTRGACYKEKAIQKSLVFNYRIECKEIKSKSKFSISSKSSHKHVKD